MADPPTTPQPETTGSQSDSATVPQPTDRRNRVALGVAVASLVLFVFISIYLLRQTGSSEAVWSRQIFIYNGIQAIAFAAAGFLFGKEVHRDRAKNAEKTVEQERSRANQATAEAERGKAFAHQVQAKAEIAAAATTEARTQRDATTREADLPQFGATETTDPVAVDPLASRSFSTPPNDPLQELASVAKKLFP